MTSGADTANAAASAALAAFDLTSIALLLDVDGTLIDIGPSPFEVDVPETLKRSLDRLYRLTGGALALVSGRPIRDLDTLFLPLKFPAVGGHGAEMRLAESAGIARIGDLPAELRRRLVSVIEPGSGLEYEDKGYSVALHYRKAPQHEARLRDHVAVSRASFADEATEVLPGKMMFEIKRPGIDKGTGVRELMRHAPFAGRIPVFIGDDVTDEHAIAVMPALNGQAFSVGRPLDGTSGMFSSPADVRQALRRVAGT